MGGSANCGCGRRVSRRFLIAVVGSTPALGWTVSSGGAFSRNLQQGDLLSPNVLNRPSQGASPRSTAGSVAPSEMSRARAARSMGASTAAALNSLLAALRARDSTVHQLQEEIRNLQKKIADAERNKAAKLQEFRDGQFCSGCNQTRSEILAKGEQFPHPGQSVVRATPQQIAQKEAQLNAEIDKLKAALFEANRKRNEDERWLLECAGQIEFGTSLWRVASEYERRALRAAEATSEEHYRKRRDSLVDQIEKAARIVEAGVPADQYPSLISDLNLWRDLIEGLVQGRRDERAQSERQYRDAELNQLREVRGVTAAWTKVLPLKNMGVSNQVQGAMGLLEMSMGGVYGGVGLARPFRMGNYNPDNYGQTLPRVIAFVEEADAFPPRLARHDDLYLPGVLSMIDVAVASAQSKLSASSYCAGEPKPAACT
jgi:hypothetical protein